jgi:hypothetical protein
VVADAGAGRAVAAAELTADGLAEAFAFCVTPEARTRAQALAEIVRRDDGVAMVVDAVHARLPLHAMRCARDDTHLATIWCQPCAQRLCVGCAGEHTGHVTQAYAWVDWSIRPPQSLIGKMLELVGDAATALGVGAEELQPRNAPPCDGVVLDGIDQDDVAGAPVHRRGRIRPA